MFRNMVLGPDGPESEHLTPLSQPDKMPGSERRPSMLQSRSRRSSAVSSMSGESTVSLSVYQQGIEELSRSKSREIERVNSRLQEAMQDVHNSEDQRREAEHEVEGLTMKLSENAYALTNLRNENASLQLAKDNIKKTSEKLRKARKLELSKTAITVSELENRIQMGLEESQQFNEIQRQHHNHSLQHEVAHSTSLRHQIRDLQIRNDELIQANKSSIRAQQKAAEITETDAIRDEVSAMRREKNEAIGALRAEKAAHSSLLERFHAVEESRDAALKHLSEMSNGRRSSSLQRSSVSSQQSNATELEAVWAQEKEQLLSLLRRKEKDILVATKKKEKIKKKEHEARQEILRLRTTLLESQIQHQQACASVPPPSSRTETPVSWTSYQTPNDFARDAEVAFLRSRVRELTHQGRYSSGFATPSNSVPYCP
eukprot:TRINITY_DN2987_c0_g2_i1.p1 TRINITY_DN2987_c0_g2~~TRINITY_DN2987_c0_g2_i1.p1  ORF type:complete len:429 (+),score=103.81 TRINITY_DN2987_c0_g2_i1:2103-3389(+)